MPASEVKTLLLQELPSSEAESEHEDIDAELQALLEVDADRSYRLLSIICVGLLVPKPHLQCYTQAFLLRFGLSAISQMFSHMGVGSKHSLTVWNTQTLNSSHA